VIIEQQFPLQEAASARSEYSHAPLCCLAVPAAASLSPVVQLQQLNVIIHGTDACAVVSLDVSAIYSEQETTSNTAECVCVAVLAVYVATFADSFEPIYRR